MTYSTEREGQISFYERFLPRINSEITLEDILSDNNDGVLNGNLIEFKNKTTNLNEHLFQCIKYLSARRIKGKPVPANILIVDLNCDIAWCYKSEPYLEAIEKVYTGGASKNNLGFIGELPHKTLHYGDNNLDAETLISVLKENSFIKIHIDENCIVGWAVSYYKAVPNARKEDFIGDDTGAHKTIGEIRKPKVFADYIFPYTGETNVKFKYLMDKLNDTLMKKNTGAFYTHSLYAEKSLELVRKAIKRVPKGNDYIILDRCAGTGNLEAGLTDEELSHCIVSTIEYYEYKVLQELIGDKVRHVIPPIETVDTFNAGFVTGADALSKEYIENPIIKRYIDDPRCTVILFENPPYAETTSAEHQKTGKSKESSAWKKSFVSTEMRKSIKGFALNDLGNAFIWSGFKYFLRQPTDSYVVYSPVKYWKVQHLVDFEFGGGYAFNRRHFHTNIDACIMCALWHNISADNENLTIEAFDIGKDCKLESCGDLHVKKVHKIYNQAYYDKREFDNDKKTGIVVGLDGIERTDNKVTATPLFNENILCYMIAKTSGFDNPDLNSGLLVACRYDAHGFYVRKDNYLEKLPMFAASRYITYNREWTERARIMKSADGSNQYFTDVSNGKLNQFLLKCLLFTCLEMHNHMRTLIGSDGRFYRNELCLDGTNGETIALRDLKKLQMNKTEKDLFKQWNIVLYYAKQTANYNPDLTYGVYQIYDELDTFHVDENSGDTIWDNNELHSALQNLKPLIKSYYNNEIVPTLFEYQFLK